MSDALEAAMNNLAAKVKHDVVVTCSKVAAIHGGNHESDDYNRAVRDIAAKILELNGPSKSVRAA